MPELPEVEVTRRQISGLLLGRTIERVETTAPSYFFLTRPTVLVKRLTGRAVRTLERRGKYLIATLDDGASLLLHLGMTGQLFAAGSSSLRLLSSTAGATLSPERQLAAFEPDAHTHLRVTFTDRGPGLYFRDARKFGKVQWLAPGERSARLDKLGVDALAATGEDLHAAARKRSAPIKTVLLDQHVLAGVGNIYADEALFLAAVKPTRAARTLSLERCSAIVAAAQQVMLRSIETGGSSINDYVRPDGSDGGYQDERRVYAREGEACSRCGGRIKRVVLGTRSSFFCPKCQR
ncbi:MAG TPA: bifunctional DNA-formamidopyrimidine glycosylase/DNA-(apurinic or apyrimidinic site) lyase [Polyangiales bacterium]|nr:bifunctional DNA-formamidopyrimidine glycosylase/DNA-(apurinic or apyrimidinic site) lyase [Polyangiales bacterium]